VVGYLGYFIRADSDIRGKTGSIRGRNGDETSGLGRSFEIGLTK
jgi:hypothetical protein